MEIKNSKTRLWWVSFWDWLRQPRLYVRVIATLIAILLLGMLIMNSMRYGIALYVSGKANTYHEFIQQLLWTARIPLTTTSHVLTGLTAKPEQLVFDFKFEDWQKLQQKQEEAIREKTLYASENPWIPVEIGYKGEKIKAEVRLKGAPDHYNNAKWSFRVEVDNDAKAIMGMKVFAIQHPQTRIFLTEWIFHKFLDYQDVLALKYDFVDVIINGKHMGIYAIEEQMEKQILERNERREGPIVVFDEDLYNMNRWQTPWRNRSREVKAYWDKQVLQDDLLTAQFVAARSLLEQFSSQKLTTCQVFDCPILARYFASLDILGAQHAAGSGNMKMYYNPLSGHFEPVGFDAEAEYLERPRFLQAWWHFKVIPDSMIWIRQIFSDPEFMEMYVRELNRLTDPKVLDAFFGEIEEEKNAKLAILYRSYPTYRFDPVNIYREQKLISDILHPEKALDAYINKVEGRTVQLDVADLLPIPIVIKGVRFNETVTELAEPIMLSPLFLDQLPVHKTISVQMPAGFSKIDRTQNELEIMYSILGLEEVRFEYPSTLPRLDYNFAEKDIIRQSPNAQTFPFLRINENTKAIVAKSGTWEIDRPLIVPRGYLFLLNSGTTLVLKNQGQIISYSPVRFIGSGSEPVIIRGEGVNSRGIAILEGGNTSLLEHVRFENLAAAGMESWQMTGAVTFYKSPVDIKDVAFVQNRNSDDALNLFSSPFTAKNISFEDTFADAFDIDFSNGSIDQMSVVRSGNDGLDISGSEIELTNYNVKSAGDKGISIGEDGFIKARNVTIFGAQVGIGSKDRSLAEIQDVTITDSNIGLAVYHKKSEFGPSRLFVNNIVLRNMQQNMMVEIGSLLRIDGEAQPSIVSDVAAKVEQLSSAHAEY